MVTLAVRTTAPSRNATPRRATMSLLRDLRPTLRGLRASPGFTATAVLTLGIAMGAAVTVAAVVDHVLLRPLPYQGAERRTVIVEDVHAFPGHIACDARSRSEIVVPVLGPAGDLIAVLDIDSDQPDAFDDEDQAGLERLMEWFRG